MLAWVVPTSQKLLNPVTQMWLESSIRSVTALYGNTSRDSVWLSGKTSVHRGGSTAIKTYLADRNSMAHKWRCEGLPLRRTGRDGWTQILSGSCHCLQGTETSRQEKDDWQQGGRNGDKSSVNYKNYSISTHWDAFTDSLQLDQTQA